MPTVEERARAVMGLEPGEPYRDYAEQLRVSAIADEIKAARRAALEEAARDLPSPAVPSMCKIADWLRARAAQIENEEDGDHGND